MPLRLSRYALYLSIAAMAVWVFFWPLLVSADSHQPGLWLACIVTLLVFFAALLGCLWTRHRHFEE